MGKSREPLFTMATGTLRSVSHSSKLSVTVFLLLYIDSTRCQQFVFPFKAPSDCSVEEFFDVSSLSCVRCGADQRQSTTGQCMQVIITCVVCCDFRLPQTQNGSLQFLRRGSLTEWKSCVQPTLKTGLVGYQSAVGSVIDLHSASETFFMSSGHHPWAFTANENDTVCNRPQTDIQSDRQEGNRDLGVMISLQNTGGFSVQALYQELHFCASQKYSVGKWICPECGKCK